MPRVHALLPGLGAASSSRIPSTVEAYLTTNVEALSEAEGGLLPHEKESLQALQAEVQRLAPPVLSGTQLYERLQASRLVYTGCDSIDSDLLRGGLRGGQMVEVCGESASGKTQLCLSAAASAARASLRVVYVDTSNAVAGRRLQQVVLAQQAAAAQAAAARGVAPPLSPVDPLKFVEVRRCYDVHALLALLDELAQQAQQQRAQQRRDVQANHNEQQQQQQQPADAPPQQEAAGAPPPVRHRLEDLPVALLIVDCLSALITPILGGGQHSQGHALLAAAATSLKAFAAYTDAAVLVTNHLVGGSAEQRHEKRPAMGESWRNQPHARIQLSRPSEERPPHHCTATLRASCLLPAGLTVAYAIAEGGLTPVLPPEAAAAAAGRTAQGGHAQQMSS